MNGPVPLAWVEAKEAPCLTIASLGCPALVGAGVEFAVHGKDVGGEVEHRADKAPW